MNIRPACQQDASQLAELIYASGPQILESVFGTSKPYNPRDFLLSALQHKDGQYGFANHYVAIEDDKILAAVCGWHSELKTHFHQATLHSVVAYFGVELSLEVLARSQITQQIIPGPQPHEWCIGHLSVNLEYQKQGVASQLLNFMTELALQNGKSQLSLDVSQDNHNAIQFYLQRGFSILSTSALTAEMQNLGFSRHLHMSKSLV
ncbi:GNAT family N-acetyltransferase [Paraglaciecola hydrolytica]|uniref:N-acetyltransferase domain-containing protein n=1 Tax=Paraglaciecola hydrolytica TaxID=1799789 RepID=A0A136A4L0_9ALTE|nr:GNAT family N-acetyltransferase [Paraglaciecola hydrolytica]KXI30161.1 hypothetical protein AX660_09220 [Paraglaciecola hydrolytica]